MVYVTFAQVSQASHHVSDGVADLGLRQNFILDDKVQWLPPREQLIGQDNKTHVLCHFGILHGDEMLAGSHISYDTFQFPLQLGNMLGRIFFKLNLSNVNEFVWIVSFAAVPQLREFARAYKFAPVPLRPIQDYV